MGWKDLPYWLKGGILVVLLGLIIAVGVFILGYSGCFILKNGEACIGLVMAAALISSPFAIFLSEVLGMNILRLSSIYFSELFGSSFFSQFILVVLLGIVSNFIIGVFLGLLYGGIRYIKKNEYKKARKEMFVGVLVLVIIISVFLFFSPKFIYSSSLTYYSAFEDPQYDCFGIKIMDEPKEDYGYGIPCFGIVYRSNKETLATYTNDELNYRFKYPLGWQVLETKAGDESFEGNVLIPPSAYRVEDRLYIARTDCLSVYDRIAKTPPINCKQKENISVYFYVFKHPIETNQEIAYENIHILESITQD